MDPKFVALASFFALMNILALAIMGIDKARSRTAGIERVSEGLLFFLAALFGSLGVYIGMFLFRHKTKKWYFIIGIPLLILQNAAFLYVVYLLLR